MSPERLVHIQKLKESKEAGIGIQNVHQRIQVYFGNEYRVNIDSELDERTPIVITIPKIKAQKDEINK